MIPIAYNLNCDLSVLYRIYSLGFSDLVVHFWGSLLFHILVLVLDLCLAAILVESRLILMVEITNLWMHCYYMIWSREVAVPDDISLWSKHASLSGTMYNAVNTRDL